MQSILSRQPAMLAAFLFGSALLLGTAGPAQASGGVFIGVAPVPFVVPPPVYPYPYYPYGAYYPPVAYAPPPAAAPQSKPAPQTGSAQSVAYGSMCRAGVYSCPVAPYTPLGSVCSCPGIGAPSFGQAH